MDNREAITWLSKFIYLTPGTEDDIKVYHYIIDILERGVPKKPYIDYKCPKCDSYLIEGNKKCQSCGQSIDWGEEG